MLQFMYNILYIFNNTIISENNMVLNNIEQQKLLIIITIIIIACQNNCWCKVHVKIRVKKNKNEVI